MFVFKAAVVGAGALAEEIAGLISASGVSLVRGDVGACEGFGDVDFVVEAVDEDLELKHQVFAELDACTPGNAILATASSRLSVTEIGEITLRPHQVVGMHFIPGARVVEIVEGDDTSAATLQIASNFAQALRRTPVRVGECPGYVVDRVSLASDLAEAYGERFTADGDRELRQFVEACLVLEEGIAGVREIDLALVLGAGMKPGPFAAADVRGLDSVLAALEEASASNEHLEPPVILRRLVAQGRLGVSAGQGFYPYPQVAVDRPVTLDMRGDIAVVWLTNPPANSLGPETVAGLGAAWRELVSGGARAMVLASANPALFCAGADIKAFTTWDADSGREHLAEIQGLGREWERSSVVTVAAVNGLAFGGGCEVAMACDFRIAALSASFGQPEISLGIIPGFGGTQRLPRLVGPSKALEMNLLGEPISAVEALEAGLVNQVVDDHELFETALSWARKAAGQAPLAVEQIKRVSFHGDIDKGLAAERDGFMTAFVTEDAREGIGAFIEKRKPEFRGR
jgi:enoyl-CoA hydratase/3-hydroxyacyl-CoA dehydrogenase